MCSPTMVCLLEHIVVNTKGFSARNDNNYHYNKQPTLPDPETTPAVKKQSQYYCCFCYYYVCCCYSDCYYYYNFSQPYVVYSHGEWVIGKPNFQSSSSNILQLYDRCP